MENLTREMLEQEEWERKMNDYHSEADRASQRHVEIAGLLIEIRDAQRATNQLLAGNPLPPTEVATDES